MKRILAIILTVAIAFCLCIPSLALVSPTAETAISVTFFGVDGKADGYYIIVTSESGNQMIEITADPQKGDFDTWSFYIIEEDSAGNQKFADAELGENIEIYIKDGEEKIPVKTKEEFDNAVKQEKLIVVAVNTPDNSLIICANYDGTFTSPVDGKRLNTKEEIYKLDPKTGKDKSPKTGDSFNGLFLLPVFSLAGVILTSKKLRAM